MYHWNILSFGIINARSSCNGLMKLVFADNNITMACLDDTKLDRRLNLSIPNFKKT